MTYEQVRKILEEALGRTMFTINESDNQIAQSLDKTWNRGANAMYNNALIGVCKYFFHGGAENGTDT